MSPIHLPRFHRSAPTPSPAPAPAPDEAAANDATPAPAEEGRSHSLFLRDGHASPLSRTAAGAALLAAGFTPILSACDTVLPNYDPLNPIDIDVQEGETYPVGDLVLVDQLTDEALAALPVSGQQAYRSLVGLAEKAPSDPQAAKALTTLLDIAFPVGNRPPSISFTNGAESIPARLQLTPHALGRLAAHFDARGISLDDVGDLYRDRQRPLPGSDAELGLDLAAMLRGHELVFDVPAELTAGQQGAVQLLKHLSPEARAQVRELTGAEAPTRGPGALQAKHLKNEVVELGMLDATARLFGRHGIDLSEQAPATPQEARGALKALKEDIREQKREAQERREAERERKQEAKKAAEQRRLERQRQRALEKRRAEDRRMASRPSVRGYKPLAQTRHRTGMDSYTREMYQRFLIQAKRLGVDTSKIVVAQGTYSTGVGQSGGTHNRGGAVDLFAPPGEYDKLLKAASRAGWAPFDRHDMPPAHIHMIAIGHPDAAWDANAQVRDWFLGRNGLVSHAPSRDSARLNDDGPRWARQMRSQYVNWRFP